MKTKLKHWSIGLLSAVVQGTSTSFLTFVGIAGMDEVGINVPKLDWKQGLAVVAMGTAVALFTYLKTHSLEPVLEDDTTTTTTKPV